MLRRGRLSFTKVLQRRIGLSLRSYAESCQGLQQLRKDLLSVIGIYRQSTARDEELQQSSRNFLNAFGVRRTWSFAPGACLAIEAISNGRLWRWYRNSQSQKSNRSRDLRKALQAHRVTEKSRKTMVSAAGSRTSTTS